LIRSVLKSLLVLAVAVPVMALLPLAAVAMTRTPDGATAVIWFGPWSCCFWCLIYMTLSAVPWQEGGAAVHQWREEHGGLLHTSIVGCFWMFSSLFFSYVAEFALLFLTRNFTWLPAATFAPLGFCWVWRRTRG
jgi:hypothetical protein